MFNILSVTKALSELFSYYISSAQSLWKWKARIMNRAGVFFEGLSSRHLYNTKLIPETPKLSLGFKEKYHDKKQKYLGEKLLRKWYLRWLEIRILSGQTFLRIHFLSVWSPCPHRVRAQSRGSEKGTHKLWETANLALNFPFFFGLPVWSRTSHFWAT